MILVDFSPPIPSIRSKWNMTNSRIWLFRILVLAAAGLMVVSFIMPWWSADVKTFGDDVVRIYPYGLQHDLGSAGGFIVDSEPPSWLMMFNWVFLGICVALLIYGMWLISRRGRLVIGLVGIAYIVFAIAATIYAAISTGTYDMSLIGAGEVTVSGITDKVNAGFLVGYYLAYSAGLILIILALFRDKIQGNSSS